MTNKQSAQGLNKGGSFLAVFTHLFGKLKRVPWENGPVVLRSALYLFYFALLEFGSHLQAEQMVLFTSTKRVRVASAEASSFSYAS